MVPIAVPPVLAPPQRPIHAGRLTTIGPPRNAFRRQISRHEVTLPFRKHLSMPGMLSEVRKCFDNVPDLVVSRGITQSDCLMTGLAVQFEDDVDAKFRPKDSFGREFRTGPKL